MLSKELKELMILLKNDEIDIPLNQEKLLQELETLDEVKEYVQESLSLSSKVCPTCGRKL